MFMNPCWEFASFVRLPNSGGPPKSVVDIPRSISIVPWLANSSWSISAHFAAILNGRACRTISKSAFYMIVVTYDVADIGTLDEQAAGKRPILIDRLL